MIPKEEGGCRKKPPVFVHFDVNNMINCTKTYCFFKTFFVYLYYVMLLSGFKGACTYDFESDTAEYN